MRTKPQLRDALAQEEARIEMAQAAIGVALANIRQIRAELRNRAPIRRAPVQSSPMTAEVRAMIWELHRAHPDWSNARIASVCNVVDGRVSETLAGKRGVH